MSHDPKELLSPIPNYIIDFDLPPEERWIEMIHDYKDKLGEAKNYLDSVETEDFGRLGPYLSSIVTKAAIYRTFSTEELIEINSMGEITSEYGITSKDLIKLNLGYDLLARCTSIVCTDKSDKNWHIRTMDWDLPYMREITINLTIKKNGKTLAQITSWPGFIGFLTGLRCMENKENNEFPWSISLNYRKIKNNSDFAYSYNFYHILRKSYPVSLAIRNAIFNCENYT